MLTNRQLLILQLTVDDFIESAQPVGSRQLSKKPEAPFSPATIRNEMADLEEMGFLEKTHTSSGRIPSEKGYRYYVDHLLKPEKPRKEDSRQIRSVFRENILETEELIRRSATILSDLTNYTSILLGPDTTAHAVKRFSIVPLNNRMAVAIIVTDNGHVENRIFDIPQGFSAADIEKMVNILNERLIGTPLVHLQQRLVQEARMILERHIHHAGELFTSFQRAVSIEPEERLYFGGKMNMMKQPEFHDVQKFQTFFEMMENGLPAMSLFQEHLSGIHVRIGSENKLDAMEDCSIITATYSAGADLHGTIAVIGPKRMDYGRVITLLELMSADLSHELEKKVISSSTVGRKGKSG